MTEWKVEDRVKCTDTACSNRLLEKDKIYTVTKIDVTNWKNIEVDNISNSSIGWRKARFKLVTSTYTGSTTDTTISGEEYNELKNNGEGVKYPFQEDEKMELKNIKGKNLKEAKKQVMEAKANAEVAYAKQELTNAIDNVDRLDREINAREEEKQSWNDIVNQFN